MDKCDLCTIKETTKKILDLLLSNKTVLDKENDPLCFHCGQPYEKDLKYCNADHNTWKPICNCLNKPTIRIVIGNYSWEDYYGD